MNILTDDNTISFDMEVNVKSEETKGALKATDLDGSTVYLGEDNKVHSKQYDDTEVREQIEEINDKLVNVGGYAEGLSYKITQKKSEPITFDWTMNKYINCIDGSRNLGDILDANSMGYAFMNVNENEVYKIDGVPFYYAGLWVMYDNNGKAIKGSLTDSVGNNTQRVFEEITIPSGVTKLGIVTKNITLSLTHVEKITNENVIINYPTEEIMGSNILFGKKWCACGDSFTAGDFTGYVDENGMTGKQSDAYDTEYGHYKTYPYWISKRNNMNVQWLALGGSDFTNADGATNPFSNPSTSNHNYSLIDDDCDYVTFMFGLNENNLTSEEIGNKNSSDNTTLWGAYKTVLLDIVAKNPTVKIGIIISDAWLSQTYHDALIEIAKYFGIPYLDLRNGETVPMQIGGRLSNYSTDMKTLRDNAFKVSSSNGHPNVKAHQYRSTVIENFLRSL